MDIRDVALWAVFALICAVPAPLISRRIWICIAIFLGSIAAAFVPPVFAVLASISGNTLIAVALPCPAHTTLPHCCGAALARSCAMADGVAPTVRIDYIALA